METQLACCVKGEGTEREVEGKWKIRKEGGMERGEDGKREMDEDRAG